jgi:tetratricopeptide (TPR) repeat protein
MAGLSENLARAKSLAGDAKYEDALELLQRTAEAETHTDEHHRLIGKCLQELKGYEDALPTLEQIKRPNVEDLKSLAISYCVCKKFDLALKSIDKAIRLEDSSHARFLRGVILTRGLPVDSYFQLSGEELDAAINEYEQAAELGEAFPNLYFYWSKAASARLSFEDGFKKKVEILEAGLGACNGVAPTLREELSRLFMYKEPARALDVLQPILNVSAKTYTDRFLLASQAAIRAKSYERAVEYLQALPESISELPGFFPVLAEALEAVGKQQDANQIWDQAIISDEPQAQILGLIGRARSSVRDGNIKKAKIALQNAVSIALDGDFITSPYEFPYFQSEFYYYDAASYYEFFKDALVLQGATEIWGEELYWRLRYCKLRIESGYDSWSDLQEEDADAMEPKEFERRNEAALATRTELFEIGKHFSHPHFSNLLAEVLGNQGKIEEALEHGYLSASWKLKTWSAKGRDYGGFYPAADFSDDLVVEAPRAQRIHQLCMKALSECQSALEVEKIHSATYAGAWGVMLKASKLTDEIRKATTSLVAKNPEKQHPDTWWDYAYYADPNDPNFFQRQEYGYRKLLAHSPDNASAAHNLALVLRRTNRHEEAWEMSKRAYSRYPNDKIIAELYNNLAPSFSYREILDQHAKALMETPAVLEDLSVRQRLYLAAVLRSCLAEDGKRILPAIQSLRKISPARDYDDRILVYLFESGVLVPSKASPGTAFTFKTLKSGKTKVSVVSPNQVHWMLNVVSRDRLSVEAEDLLAELQDPPVIPFDDLDSLGAELWHEVAVEECLEHLQQFRAEVKLDAEIGDKTRETFSDLMKRHSVAQVVGIIKKKVPECLAAFESGKAPSRKHAANWVPGNCQNYAEFLAAKGWTPNPNSRHPECEQSVISKILFDRLLEVGPEGFYRVPGTFGGGVYSRPGSMRSEPIEEA